MKVLILGAGFSGKAIARLMCEGGHAVSGTTRDPDKFDDVQATGAQAVQFDGRIVTDALRQAIAETTHLVVSIAPPRQENLTSPDAIVDPTLGALQDEGLGDAMPTLQWIGYLSTVGVYGNHDGAWIDEATPVSPQSARSRQRVRAEAEWLAMGEARSLPVAIFRLSGIYGPGRNALRTMREGRARRLVKAGQVFNRIHVADIATAVMAAAEQQARGIFNITDDEPAPPQDVVAYAHELAGRKPPPEIDFETADLSPMARSFYGENKRVSNARSKSELGMTYAFPNYRVALKHLWDTETV